jgi:site-specific DNA-methyltransferase (adenine-specific)
MDIISEQVKKIHPLIRMQANNVYLGDCLELMPDIEDHSIDMILCDLPYGTTQNNWDSVIPLAPLWQQYKRIIKSNGVIVLTAQSPFDKVLGVSNLKGLKYEWIWKKVRGTGHLNANKMPLKNHENILVFYDAAPVYNPQMTTGEPYIDRSAHRSTNYGRQREGMITINNGTRYPLSVQDFGYDKEKVHPTQKPVALFEYMIKTYTNPGDTVLDNCAGSGTTAIACLNTGRDYILIEKDEGYFQTISTRIANWYSVSPTDN